MDLQKCRFNRPLSMTPGAIRHRKRKEDRLKLLQASPQSNAQAIKVSRPKRRAAKKADALLTHILKGRKIACSTSSESKVMKNVLAPSLLATTKFEDESFLKFFPLVDLEKAQYAVQGLLNAPKGVAKSLSGRPLRRAQKSAPTVFINTDELEFDDEKLPNKLDIVRRPLDLDDSEDYEPVTKHSRLSLLCPSNHSALWNLKSVANQHVPSTFKYSLANENKFSSLIPSNNLTKCKVPPLLIRKVPADSSGKFQEQLLEEKKYSASELKPASSLLKRNIDVLPLLENFHTKIAVPPKPIIKAENSSKQHQTAQTRSPSGLYQSVKVKVGNQIKTLLVPLKPSGDAKVGASGTINVPNNPLQSTNQFQIKPKKSSPLIVPKPPKSSKSQGWQDGREMMLKPAANANILKAKLRQMQLGLNFNSRNDAIGSQKLLKQNLINGNLALMKGKNGKVIVIPCKGFKSTSADNEDVVNDNDASGNVVVKKEVTSPPATSLPPRAVTPEPDIYIPSQKRKYRSISRLKELAELQNLKQKLEKRSLQVVISKSSVLDDMLYSFFNFNNNVPRSQRYPNHCKFKSYIKKQAKDKINIENDHMYESPKRIVKPSRKYEFSSVKNVSRRKLSTLMTHKSVLKADVRSKVNQEAQKCTGNMKVKQFVSDNENSNSNFFVVKMRTGMYLVPTTTNKGEQTPLPEIIQALGGNVKAGCGSSNSDVEIVSQQFKIFEEGAHDLRNVGMNTNDDDNADDVKSSASMVESCVSVSLEDETYASAPDSGNVSKEDGALAVMRALGLVEEANEVEKLQTVSKSPKDGLRHEKNSSSPDVCIEDAVIKLEREAFISNKYIYDSETESDNEDNDQLSKEYSDNKQASTSSVSAMSGNPVHCSSDVENSWTNLLDLSGNSEALESDQQSISAKYSKKTEKASTDCLIHPQHNDSNEKAVELPFQQGVGNAELTPELCNFEEVTPGASYGEPVAEVSANSTLGLPNDIDETVRRQQERLERARKRREESARMLKSLSR